jgi:RNA polymerase sigma-70 factor (ECF subfamily)
MALERDAQPSDSVLIRRAAAGDRAAFNTLARRHQPAVYRFALTLTRDAAAAEEALQDAFLAAYRGARRYRDDAPVETWLLSFARNAVFRRLRRDGQSGEPGEAPALSELGRAAGWSAGDGDPFVELLARRDVLEAALSAVPVEDRELLVLCDLEGFTLSEAAAVTGLTEASATSRLNRARLRLMARIRETHGR